MRSAADKFKEDLTKRVNWWRTEFDLDHWTLCGVMMDLLVDILFGYVDDDDEAEDEEDEEED